MSSSIVCLLLGLFSLSAAQEVINIGFIYSGGGQYISSGVEPAVSLAVSIINNRTDILDGYQLNISYTGDSNCDRAQSQQAFFVPQLSERSPDNIALLGCGCSLATEPIAEVAQYWNMIHMSYASSADVLSDRTRFPNFWRTYPVESNLASSVLSLMTQYGWTQLKIITQNEPIFTFSTDTVNTSLSDSNITVDQSGESLFNFNSVTDYNATRLFSPEIRVYFLNMYPVHARRVFCAAARAKEGEADERFAYDKYVWITLGWYRDNWWTFERMRDDLVNCTDEDVEQFLPQTLGIIQANTADNTTAETDVQLTSEEFLSEYNELLKTSGHDFEHSAFHAFDAVWTLAFAMDSYLKENRTGLINYNYLDGNATVTDIQSRLSDTNFTGVSGEVELNNNGTRVADDPRILKYRDANVTNNCGQTGPSSIERRRVAFVMSGVNGTNSTSYEYFDCEDDNTTWPGGIPVDGSPKMVTVAILTPLVIVYYLLAAGGIIFAVACLLFNFIFRNRKIVKLISPNLNYVIIFGAIMLYASIFFFVFPSTDEFWVSFACHIRLWLQGIGYFSCFGTIVFKMWRVYYIFSNPAVNKKKKSRIPKDWQLFIGSCCLVSVCLIVLIVVAIVGDYKATLVNDEELQPGRDESDGSVIIFQNLVCDGPNDIIWIAGLYAYIVLTQLAAVLLAIRTRKVNIKALNDAKYIAGLIYASTVILIIMLVCAVLLDRFLNIDAAVFSALLFTFTTLVLSLVFIPKMVILYKDPQGQKIFQRSMSQTNTILATTADEDDKGKYLELEQHCRELEGRLAKCGEVVPAFRPRSFTSSMKLKSNSFSSIPPSSPTRRITISAPATPTKTTLNDTHMVTGTSGYFTEPERMSDSSAEPKSPTEIESGKL